jgi:hypothetical protein
VSEPIVLALVAISLLGAAIVGDVLDGAGRSDQATCPVCAERLGTSRGVLFQGDDLVHAACWRAEAAPAQSPLRPPARPEPRATILIVEDQADTRDAMGVLVTQTGVPGRPDREWHGSARGAPEQPPRPDPL